MSIYTNVQKEINAQIFIRDQATAAIGLLRKLIANEDVPEGEEEIAPKNPGRIAIPVNQIDPINGKTINTFASISAAAKATGINGQSISNALSGQQVHAGGYKWVRADGMTVIKQTQSVCMPTPTA